MLLVMVIEFPLGVIKKKKTVVVMVTQQLTPLIFILKMVKMA